MDEKMQELVETTLRERFEIADFTLRKESDAYAEMTQRVVALSESISRTPDISAELKCEIASYLSLAAEMDDVFRRHLYRQGAKDCVEVLRELDLIKGANGGG